MWNTEAEHGNVAALKNPTNPDSAVESSASSVVDSSLAHSGDMITPGPSNTYGESNYEVFDPLNWLLDGLVDMPSYNMSGLHDMEAPGIV